MARHRQPALVVTSETTQGISMKPQSFRLLAATSFLCILGSYAAWAGPVLDGSDVSGVACRQARTTAIAKFNSPDTSMSGPISLVKDSPVRFALQVKDEDISGGDALTADTAIFSDQVEHRDGNPIRHVFWQIAPRGGKRIVVVDRAFNWEGDCGIPIIRWILPPGPRRC